MILTALVLMAFISFAAGVFAGVVWARWPELEEQRRCDREWSR